MHGSPTTPPALSFRRTAAIAAAALILAVPLAAQQPATGRVAGHVLDPTGHPLTGATIRLVAGRATTLTDHEGFFQLGGVSAGRHSLEIRYLGFAPDTIRIDVASRQTAEERVVLTPGAFALAPLVVRGRVQGQARGLMERRSADRIVDVETSDVIQSRPDANVADAIGRLPGVSLERDEGEGKYLQIRGTEPSFSNVTINGAHVPSPEGDTRTVKLDIIPAAVVSEVQLSKTLTPDMEADAIGGSVNLVTKTPERGEPTASVSLLGGHTDLRDNTAYNASAVVGGRFGPDDRLGFTFTGSYDRNNRPIDDVEPVFDTGTLGGSIVPVVAEVDERLYSYERARGGFGGTLDYRLGDQSSLYTHFLYSDFHNYGVRYRADAVPSDGDVTPTSATAGTATGGTISREVQTRRPAEQIYSVVAGGSHVLSGGMALDYSVSYSHSQQKVANGRNTAFAMDGVDYTYNDANPKFPTFTVTNGAPVADPSAFAFDKFDIQNNLSADHELAGGANLAIPYTWGTLPARFKVGFRLSDQQKRRINNDSVFSAYNGSFTLADVLSGIKDPGFYYGHYDIGPVPSAGAADQFQNEHRSDFVYNRSKSLSSTEGADYNGEEKVYALYGMQSVDLGALNVLAGVRLEATHGTATGNLVQLDSAGHYVSSTPVSGAHNYTDLFPSLHLKYAIDARTSIRFAATEGIARPAFADLAPYLVTSQGLRTLTEGNPDLQPTHSYNLDLILDHYAGSIGVFSVSAYYKKITDFIFTRREQLASGTYAGYFASKPDNGDYGHILGAEVELQHRFTALPGALSGLGIDGNLNVSDSRARVPTADGVRFAAMPRQGRSNANLELTYDRDRVSFRGGLTYNARNIWEYGDDPASDVYLDNHLQFDANATLEVTPQVRLVAQMLNISNEVFGFYQGTAATPIQREFYGRTLFLGFRYTD